MNHSNSKFIETFSIIIFPIALFVGCTANENTKPDSLPNSKSSTSDYESTITFKDFEKLDYVESSHTEALDTQTTPANEDNTEANTNVVQAEDIAESSSPETASTDIGDMDTIVKTNTTETISNVQLIEQPKELYYFFATDKHQISDEVSMQLQQHANYLIKSPLMILTINGHADYRGSDIYNQTLSERRAHEIQQELLSLGVAESQMVIKGFGESKPLSNKETLEENRRVELIYSDTRMLSAW